jgi:hypothetical protein
LLGLEIHVSVSAKGAISNQPGASPQEFKWRCKQALKARFNWLLPEVNRAFSAGVFGSP